MNRVNQIDLVQIYCLRRITLATGLVNADSAVTLFLGALNTILIENENGRLLRIGRWRLVSYNRILHEHVIIGPVGTTKQLVLLRMTSITVSL